MATENLELNARRGEMPLVSVIIPTLNAAASLGRCLASIKNQTYSRIEVIVVDGGSHDGTRSVAQELGAKLFEESVGRSAARRLGAAHSQGSFLLFVDADQVLEPGVIEECVKASRLDAAQVVIIPEEDLGTGLWAPCRRLERHLAQVGGLAYPRFIFRLAYEAAGGHSEDLQDFMEDRDLFLRLRANSVRFAECKGRIINPLGKVNPFVLGLKGLRSAGDAKQYYRRNLHRGESLWRVIKPRIKAFFSSGDSLRSFPSSTALLLPAYLTIVYGPRYIKALIGS